MSVAITVEGAHKTFAGTPVLTDVSLAAQPGKFTVLTGPSGSGKTTLLNLVSALDTADAGTIHVGSTEVTALPRRHRTAYRADLGLVFQRSGLLGGLTARQNIEAGHTLTRRNLSKAWVQTLAARLGIVDVLDRRAALLSGGQAQRVALLRSLAHRPDVLLADEPTAAVDGTSKKEIHELLHWVTRDSGTTILMVSHDALSPHYADQTFILVDGRIRVGLTSGTASD